MTSQFAPEGFPYLTAVLRLFFSIPEFCKVLLAWQPPAQQRHPSIPRELQAILRALQCSGPLVSTLELRHSFGWADDDGMVADFGEMFTVLFESLTKAFPELAQALPFIGALSCSTFCHGCHRTKETPEVFNQLILTVSHNTMKPLDPPTLEQSLKGYLAPETMTGSNRAFCETCRDKRVSVFQTKIQEFPSYLLLRLNRSSFDFNTMCSVKDQSQLFFPETLNIDGHPPYELWCVVLDTGRIGSSFCDYTTVSRPGTEWERCLEGVPKQSASVAWLQTSEYFINQLSGVLYGLLLSDLCTLIAQYAIEFNPNVFAGIRSQSGPSTTAIALLYHRRGIDTNLT